MVYKKIVGRAQGLISGKDRKLEGLYSNILYTCYRSMAVKHKRKGELIFTGRLYKYKHFISTLSTLLQLMFTKNSLHQLEQPHMLLSHLTKAAVQI